MLHNVYNSMCIDGAAQRVVWISGHLDHCTQLGHPCRPQNPHDQNIVSMKTSNKCLVL